MTLFPRDKLLNRHAFSVIAAIIVRVLGSVVSLVINYLLFRTIGDVGTGYFLLAYSTIVLTTAVTGCGVELIVLRQTAAAAVTSQWGEANSVFSRCFLIVSIASTLLASLSFFFADPVANMVFRKPDFAASLRMICPAIISLPLIVLISRSLQGWRKINSSIFIQNIATGLLFSLVLLLHPPVTEVEACFYFSLASILTVGLGLVAVRSVSKVGSGETTYQTIFKSAKSVWVMVVVETLTKFVALIFAGRYCTPVEVAALAISQRLAMVSSIALSAAVQNVAPTIAAAWRKNEVHRIQEVTRKAISIGMLLAAPFLLSMLFVPESVLGFFSESISGGARLLQVAAIGQVVAITFGINSWLLTMCDHESGMRDSVIASGFVAVISGWILTMQFGVMGAAISTVLAVCTMNYMSSRKVRRHLGFYPAANLFRSIRNSK